MSLRMQKKGHQKPWTLPELESGLKHFYTVHKQYPTAHEVDAYTYLPSARSIERGFGGLVALRKLLKLGSEHDFRAGIHSSKRAHTINARAHETEQKVYEFLHKRFGKEFVHREFFFTDDKRTRLDFFVHDSEQGFCIDVFYPKDRRNLIGCLNSKLLKYKAEYMSQYPVIFLQMNEDINQDALNKLIQNKKKQWLVGQHLMSWDTFQIFASSKKPLKKMMGDNLAKNTA